MSKLKKVNRGVLFFIAILVVVVVMIVVESSMLSAAKKNIMKTIRSVVDIELGYMIVPNEVRAGWENDEVVDAYIDRLKNETVSLYASSTVHSAEELCLSDLNYLRDRIIIQCENSDYYTNLEVNKASFVGFGGGEDIDMINNEASVSVKLQMRVNDSSLVNVFMSYNLIKENGEWKILSSEFSYAS